MKTIVTGASGMLGGQVYRQLLAAGEDVEGWSYRTARAPDGIEFCPYWLKSRFGPNVDAVIHCGAITDADYAEAHPEEAWETNVVWPGDLAATARNNEARFIYISSDSIYDDEAPGQRSEDDRPNPLSIYARSKWLGEQAVLLVYPEATIVRTTMLGYTLVNKREKLSEWIIRSLIQGTSLTLFSDAIFSPLHVSQLASYLIELRGLNYPGVLNVGSAYPVSKYNLGLQIAERFGLDPSPIIECRVAGASLAAKRTRNTGLDVRRAMKIFEAIPSPQDGIERLFQDYTSGTVKQLKGRPWP